MSLYILNEIITNNFDYNFLTVMSLLSILFGVFVIISKNPILSVLFLIGLFIAIASYLMTLGINFIGLSYLLVYVGAVSILFLFILMLINIRVSEIATNNTNSIPLAILVGTFFNISMSKLFIYKSSMGININNILNTDIYSITHDINYILNNISILYRSELYFVTSYLWDGRLAETFHITSIGNIIYTNYPIWLLLTSIILLLAMVGSIIITIKQ